MSLTVHEAAESAHMPALIFRSRTCILIRQIICLRITLLIATTGPILSCERLIKRNLPDDPRAAVSWSLPFFDLPLEVDVETIISCRQLALAPAR